MLGSRRLRLPLVAVAAVVALAAGSIAVAGVASSSPRLPTIAPDHLVASVLEALAAGPTIEGHVDAHVDLGLPNVVSGALTQEAGGIASLLGDHHLRVWRSPDGLRITDQLSLGERSIYVDRTDRTAWLWDWESFTAYRAGPLPGEPAAGANGSPSVPDPLDLARMALRAIDRSTAVSVASPQRVAGRAAYVLVLQPRTSATLVGRVEIAVDAERWLPLRVAVVPRGSDAPALSAAFTTVAFGPIAPSIFRFVPPPGAAVRSLPDLIGGSGMAGAAGMTGLGGYLGGPSEARAFGSGWATVAAVRLPQGLISMATSSGELDPFSLLPFSGNLFSIRLVERGDHAWLVYGAVPQSSLARVEGQLR